MKRRKLHMRNKRNFNNLFDSICITSLLFACLAFYLVMIWFGAVNPKEGTNPIATIIISTIIFSIMMTLTITLIVKGCYEYWILFDDSILSKKLFSKKVIIKFTEIEKVEKKVVPALVLGMYKSEAYIIYSKVNKIVILTDERKKFPELDSQLTEFMDE